VLKGLHNLLGEHGESLTLLSLLKPMDSAVPLGETEGDLNEISSRLLQLAGDESEVVDMYSVVPNEGGSLEFLSLELIPLRQAIEEMRRYAGDNEETVNVLSVVDPSEQIEDQPGTVNQALSHLRDALRALFNKAGESGQHLTVLSVLSRPSKKADPEE
jgi:hypothetical protein